MEAKTVILLDGKVTSWHEAELSPAMLLGCNWVYTTINTFAHKPLHLQQKLHYALESYRSLYGPRPTIECKELEREIGQLLYFGLYPEGGNTVTLYLIPSERGVCRRLLIHEATTPYEGYGLLSVRPRGIITNYEIPFEKHQTNVSLTAARFADSYASSHGYNIAIRANRAGTLLSSGDNPLFALRGNTLLTTPTEKGARPSAERDLMFRLAEKAGVKVIEEELTVEDAASYEELMIFTPVGIQTLYSLGDMKVSNIYGSLLGEHLTALSREGLGQ